MRIHSCLQAVLQWQANLKGGNLKDKNGGDHYLMSLRVTPDLLGHLIIHFLLYIFSWALSCLCLFLCFMHLPWLSQQSSDLTLNGRCKLASAYLLTSFPYVSFTTKIQTFKSLASLIWAWVSTLKNKEYGWPGTYLLALIFCDIVLYSMVNTKSYRRVLL